ncbi:MAG: hypothetical protein ACTHM7_06250 [Ginsengibacter sp.]
MISPAPNYNIRTKTAIDTTLTDGKYSKGTYFWSQPTTLGWVKMPRVKITIDLGNVSKIGAVTFNTCQRVDSLFNVRYPDHIFIFLSKDNSHYWYAGDAVEESGNLPGPYQIKNFELSSINQQARYVTLSVIPNDHLLFCDEISVIKGDLIRGPLSSVFDIGRLDATIDSLISSNFYRNYLLLQNNSARDRAEGHIQQRVLNNISELNDSKISSKKLSEIDSLINTAHFETLRKQFKNAFIIEKVVPWDSITPFYDPKSSHDDLNYQFFLPSGGRQYGAFTITNLSKTRQNFTFKTSFSGSHISLNLFNAYFVPSLNYRLIPDALIPVTDAGISIDRGKSALLFFKLNVSIGGQTNASIEVNAGSQINKLYLQINAMDINNADNCILNANVWFNNHHPMLADRQSEAFTDLKNHHINTILVGPGYLSPLNKPDFLNLPDFLSNCQYAKKLLISTNFSSLKVRQPDEKILFMSAEWKTEFIEWYNSLLNVINKGGFSSSAVYFYPYDEVNVQNVADFINFAEWAKNAVPNFKLFATLTSSIIPHKKEFNELMGLLDIAQIGTFDPIVLPELPVKHGEIWVYENNGNSTSESPYSHYRLMSWDAYFNNVSGIGFWSYTGDPRKKFITDPFTNINMDYGVVYDGPGRSIISSRRWEAFSLGLEDYQILCLYGNKFGRDNSKKLVRQVLANRDNIYLADEIRDQMMKSLIRK